jgi:hypothetical protein
LGYLETVVLRYGVVAPVLILMLNESMHALVEPAFDHPLDEVVEHYRASVPFNTQRTAQLWSLLARRT